MHRAGLVGEKQLSLDVLSLRFLRYLLVDSLSEHSLEHFLGSSRGTILCLTTTFDLDPSRSCDLGTLCSRVKVRALARTLRRNRVIQVQNLWPSLNLQVTLIWQHLVHWFSLRVALFHLRVDS